LSTRYRTIRTCHVQIAASYNHAMLPLVTQLVCRGECGQSSFVSPPQHSCARM
jgi:hypothetical protein